MSDLLAARSQMAMSLAFHIVFACAGMAMPLLMVLAERRYHRKKDPLDLELARRWARGTAILFAVGAVSGTVLSFELGLLWPEFMRFAGPVIGMPFSLEGFAFFLEAIGLGLYLYGWKRLSPRVHLAAGWLVLASGVASGLFVVTANAWMNTPTGFTLDAAGKIADVDPIAAMLNPAALTQCLHMIIAAFVAVGFAVAGIHAWRLRKHPGSAFDRRALGLALAVGGVAAVLQPISGDLSAKHLAEHQPVKLAAMEGHWETQRCAPLHLGGIPDEEDEVTRFAIAIPCGLSILAHLDPDAEVMGLKDVPRDLRPPVLITHLAFQVMVGIGVLLMFTALYAAFHRWRKKVMPTGRRFLALLVLCGPLGFVAVEAGWFVTEVGRQPWVVHGLMKTADAVTPMPGLVVPFLVFSALYVVLAIMVVVLLRRHVFRAPTAPDAVAPSEVPHAG
ncbi:MAG: cytochrome ubiquinol oxidase subunit I [Deltaproteobacteria bacterium]|nr:cytochrome ubiquinol oxidase subunit I [Deltaproteobacteria bacterium]